MTNTRNCLHFIPVIIGLVWWDMRLYLWAIRKYQFMGLKVSLVFFLLDWYILMGAEFWWLWIFLGLNVDIKWFMVIFGVQNIKVNYFHVVTFLTRSGTIIKIRLNLQTASFGHLTARCDYGVNSLLFIWGWSGISRVRVLSIWRYRG
jgi:hypothetical protein